VVRLLLDLFKFNRALVLKHRIFLVFCDQL
jgi:hypothetical protein